jgi:large subunit ribosomal protein L25
MQESFEINAELRTDKGKGASRRLRRTDNVPAIIYGGKEDPQSLTIKHNELILHLENEAFYSHVLGVNVGGKIEKAVLRDVQRHPSKPRILHVDFLRVSETEKLRMNIPLHFMNEDVAIGVKQQGGVVSHLSTEVEVSCLAKDLPEYIEVDLTNLELGHSIHLSELKLPSGVELVELSHGESHDQAIVNIHKAKKVVEEEPVVPEAAASDAEKSDAEGGKDEGGDAS